MYHCKSPMCEMCRDDSVHTYTWQDHLRAFRAAAEAEAKVKEATEDTEEVGAAAVKRKRTVDALSENALQDAAEQRSQALPRPLIKSNPNPNPNPSKPTQK